MKRNKYFYILVAGFVLWVIETAAFGFNKEPQSGFEGFLDVVAVMLMVFGAIGDITTNLRIHKTYHNITNIKTQKVQFKDEANIASYNVGIKSNKKPL